jgi:hypothetical protein
MMETPLLASHDDDGNDGLRPSLSSSGSHLLHDQEETEFSRLIAQRSSFAFGLVDQHGANEWSHLDASSPFTPSTSRLFTNIAAAERGKNKAAAGKVFHVRGKWGIVAASTCFAIFVGSTLAAYTSRAWTQPLLQIQSSLMNSELKLSAVALSDWISVSTSSSWILFILMPVVSLVLPCSFLIFAPSWILVDGNPRQVISIERRILQPSFLRSTLELGMRWCFLFIYLFIFQDAILLKCQWQGSEAAIRFRSQHSSGFSAFLWACLGSIGLILVLRSPPQKTPFDSHDPKSANTIQVEMEGQMTEPKSPLHPESMRFQQIRTPPRHAFQHLSSRGPPETSGRGQENDEDEEFIVPLEESPLPCLRPLSQPDDERQSPPPPSPVNHVSGSSASTPELVDEEVNRGEGDDEGNDQLGNGTNPSAPRRRSVSSCRKVLVFELGLLTLVMWMPILYTPWISIRVETAASESKAVLNWSDLLFTNAWEQGIQARTDAWLRFALAVVAIAQLVIIPLLASALGILVWLGEGSWCTTSRHWLYCIQPAMGGMVASVALILMISYQEQVLPPLMDLGAPSLGDILASTFSMCHQEARQCGECMVRASTRTLTGSRFYAIHSILLEIFVQLTLKWSLQ